MNMGGPLKHNFWSKSLSHSMWISGWTLALPIIIEACYLSCDQHAKLGLSSNQHMFYPSNPTQADHKKQPVAIRNHFPYFYSDVQLMHTGNRTSKPQGTCYKSRWVGRDSSDQVIQLIQLLCDNPLVPTAIIKWVTLHWKVLCVRHSKDRISGKFYPLM